MSKSDRKEQRNKNLLENENLPETSERQKEQEKPVKGTLGRRHEAK